MSDAGSTTINKYHHGRWRTTEKFILVYIRAFAKINVNEIYQHDARPLNRGVKRKGNTGAFPTQYELIRVMAVFSQPRTARPMSTTPSYYPLSNRRYSTGRRTLASQAGYPQPFFQFTQKRSLPMTHDITQPHLRREKTRGMGLNHQPIEVRPGPRRGPHRHFSRNAPTCCCRGTKMW